MKKNTTCSYRYVAERGSEKAKLLLQIFPLLCLKTQRFSLQQKKSAKCTQNANLSCLQCASCQIVNYYLHSIISTMHLELFVPKKTSAHWKWQENLSGIVCTTLRRWCLLTWKWEFTNISVEKRISSN